MLEDESSAIFVGLKAELLRNVADFQVRLVPMPMLILSGEQKRVVILRSANAGKSS